MLNSTAIHRIDIHTSGVLIIGRSKEFAQGIGHKMMTRSDNLQKLYFARISGKFPVMKEIKTVRIAISQKDKRAGTWQAVENGTYDACTLFYAIAFDERENTSLLMCRPITGRTHQIRIHLEALQCPIVNDPHYGIQHEHKRKAECQDEEEPASKKLKFISSESLDVNHISSQPTTKTSADSSDALFEIDPLCKDCVEELREAKEYTRETVMKTQMIYLHAWMYIHNVPPLWKYRSEMPEWVKEDLKSANLDAQFIDDVVQVLLNASVPQDLKKTSNEEE